MGNILKVSKELLNATKTATETGAAIGLVDSNQGFLAIIKAATVIGTNPTFDAKLQHSHNGSDWFDLVSFTQITANSTEMKAISGDVLKYLRYDLTVGGTTPSADLEIYFISDDTTRLD